jgi:hypothetical protein
MENLPSQVAFWREGWLGSLSQRIYFFDDFSKLTGDLAVFLADSFSFLNSTSFDTN